MREVRMPDGTPIQRVRLRSDIARARDAHERRKGLDKPKPVGEFNVSAQPGERVVDGITGKLLRRARKVPKGAIGIMVRVTFWKGGLVGAVELLTIAASFMEGLTSAEARIIIASHVLRILRSQSLRLSRRSEGDDTETDAATVELFWV